MVDSESKRKRSSLAFRCLCRNLAAVASNDPLNRRQSDADPGEIGCRMKPLECAE